MAKLTFAPLVSDSRAFSARPRSIRFNVGILEGMSMLTDIRLMPVKVRFSERSLTSARGPFSLASQATPCQSPVATILNASIFLRILVTFRTMSLVLVRSERYFKMFRSTQLFQVFRIAARGILAFMMNLFTGFEWRLENSVHESVHPPSNSPSSGYSVTIRIPVGLPLPAFGDADFNLVPYPGRNSLISKSNHTDIVHKGGGYH